MLSDNIKNLRKAKGLSQDELAAKLNVVRQTVSKWENGLSVPDSEMLIKIAEELDTSVSLLLDETIKPDEESELKILSAKLEVINKQLIEQNENRRKVRRNAFAAAFAVSAAAFIVGLIKYIYFMYSMNDMSASIAIIGGADGPTAIAVSDKIFNLPLLLIMIIIAGISAFGVYKNRRNK